jgi:hypothetical protein
MNAKFLVPSLLLVVLSLPACVPTRLLSTGAVSPPAASLGPDGVPVEQSKSSLPARMKAGVGEIWAWYNALKGKVDPAIEPMRKLYVAAQELIGAVDAQDWMKAIGLAATAWGLVDEVKGMVAAK